jgi:nicotinamidase-related amidase
VQPWDGDVLARYRASGLAGRLNPGKRLAVVVVDLQNGFTDPACGPGFAMDGVVEGTRRLLDAARAAGVPVYFTSIAFPAERPDPVWLRKMPALDVLRPGSGWELVDERLVPRADERIVTKQTASAFAGTDFAAELAASGVDTLVIAGATTSGCVRATAVDACAADLITYVVEDCVGDREQGPHEAALLDIDAKYADVVSLDEALVLVGGGTR